MTYVYEDEDGNIYTDDELKQLDVCSICGANAPEFNEEDDEEGFIDGEHPTLHNRGVSNGIASICFNCLENGVSRDKLEKAFNN